jgi:hypothetical protein
MNSGYSFPVQTVDLFTKIVNILLTWLYTKKWTFSFLFSKKISTQMGRFLNYR